MKVFALGGYGRVGVEASRLLARSDLVTDIAIAGRSLSLAKDAAHEIGQKASAIGVDGTDEQKLCLLSAGYNAVINTAASSTVLPALRTAIRNRAHYCDVEVRRSILDKALQLSSAAHVAGRTAIVANGVTPGLSNLMGVRMARELDEVLQLQCGKSFMINYPVGRELTPALWLDDREESLVALRDSRQIIGHMLRKAEEEGLRKALAYSGGQWVESDPVRNGVDAPTTEGSTAVVHPYLCGNHYPSLPDGLARFDSVDMRFSPLPPQLHNLLREHILRVLEREMDSATAVQSFYDSVEGNPDRWLAVLKSFVVPPEIWVRAIGTKEGRAAQSTCWLRHPRGEISFLTGAALATAVLRIGRGEIGNLGVMTAETAFEPATFFDEMVSVMPIPPPDGYLMGHSFQWMH